MTHSGSGTAIVARTEPEILKSRRVIHASLHEAHKANPIAMWIMQANLHHSSTIVSLPDGTSDKACDQNSRPGRLDSKAFDCSTYTSLICMLLDL